MARYHHHHHHHHHHHSGYLADDEAGHHTYMARMQLPKKRLIPEMGPTYKLGRVPHPSSVKPFSEHQGLQQNPRRPQAFGSFLDFLTEGQVLDSLQTVVEKATDRVATMKTEAGVPLVEVRDPLEVPSGRQRARPRPSFNPAHQRRAQPTLCAGYPNNYPSCSSSMSDSHSSMSHSQDSDPGARGRGSLPPMRDRLLLERNLKRLLRLENRGKGLNQSCSKRDSLLWDSLGSQTSSQWTREQPLSWFSGLLGSSSTTPETSELGLGEQEMIFLKQELNKEMKSLLSQPAPFNLPTYCPLREPHRTLDFLAEHHLFPALQRVVSQAVDKLSHACRHDGFPLFPVASEPTPVLPVNSDLLQPKSKTSLPTNREDREEPFDSPTTASSPKTSRRKSKGRRGSPSKSNDQMATRFRLKVIPAEVSDVPRPLPQSMQESPDSDPKLQKQTVAQSSKPCHGLHLILPAPGITVEMASCQSRLTSRSPNTKFSKKKPLPSISSVSSLSYISNPWFEELTNFLVEQAVSLLICKYKFEDSLNKQLGFISFPITEVLMDIFLGFKKVKGTHIRLSSDINWTCLLRKLEEAELARQAMRHAKLGTAQPSASRIGTSQHSTESPSIHPEVTGDTNQDQVAESGLSLHPDMPVSQLQDPGVAQEQIPRILSETKLSMLSSAVIDSRPSKSKEMVNKEEDEDGLEEEGESEEGETDEGESEEGETQEGETEDEIKDSYEGEHTPLSLQEPELEDFLEFVEMSPEEDSP